MAQFFVDGQDLDDAEGRWFVDYAALLPGVGAREVATLRLPGRSRTATKRLGWSEGSLKVVLDLPPAGSMRGLPVEPVESRVRLLKALLARAETVTMVEDGVARSVGVVDVKVSDPSRLGVDAWRLNAEFSVDPFWVGVPGLVRAVTVDEFTTTSVQVTSLAPAVFTEWAGTTGDIVEGVLRVRGPLTKASIVAADGSGVSFERTLTASQYVFIDLASFTAWHGSASAWEPTATVVLLDYPAAGPLRVSPSAAGVELTMTGTGFTSGTTGLQLRAQKFWL